MTLTDLHNIRTSGRTPAHVVALCLADVHVPDDVIKVLVVGQPRDLRCVVGLHVVVIGTTEKAITLAERCMRFGARHIEVTSGGPWMSVVFNWKKWIKTIPPLWSPHETDTRDND